MVDLASIGAIVVAVLKPYAKKAIEDFAGKAGELALEKTKQLSSWLQEKLSGDDYSKGTFERFEKDPDKYAPMLEDVVREASEKDSQFANELNGRLEEIEAAGTSVRVVQKIKLARKKVIGIEADDVVNADLTVDQDIGEAGDDVVGARLGSLGGRKKTDSKDDQVS